MKVLLVNPSQTKVYGKMKSPDYPPLGLAYIGAVLEDAGHQVRIIDIDADGITQDNFIEIVKERYELVGFTATTPTFENAEKLCALVKKNTEAVTVLGGIHATIVGDEVAKSDSIDFVVRSEGEATILELIEVICGKKKAAEVKGISFMDSGTVNHTPDRDLIKNLDDIPFPARHLFNHQKYVYPDSLLTPVMPIITSRGCPNSCTYCCVKLIYHRRFRYRSAENIVDEIEKLIDDYGVKEIHFWDDNFTLLKKRVFGVRDELKRRNIKLKFAFPNGLRVDRVDEEILRCLKDMGVYSIAFGVESGNQNILNNAKKGITLSQIEKAYSLAKKIGFETWGFFIIGLPGETKETIRDTIKLAKKINPDIAKFHILKPFPGTKVFDELNEKGLITEYDYSHYGIHTRPVHRLPDLDEDELMKWAKQAYREFYLRPSKIFGLLLRTKSWDRFKLNVKTGFFVLKSMR
ncbi:radical SAM protein [Candidatus Pacearchaeota archaeon]|nr:radical SAM protein [Candidatus Pacearchaeota archaeon]